jgi:hypothetical protein
LLEQEVLAAWLVLATRRIELSRNEDFSGVMQNNTDPDQRSVDWEVERGRQVEQTFTCLANKPDVAQETRWRAQSCKEQIGVFNGSGIERHALARPTYQVSAAPAERTRRRRLLQTGVGQA